jgi:hypothetical protein
MMNWFSTLKSILLGIDAISTVSKKTQYFDSGFQRMENIVG